MDAGVIQQQALLVRHIEETSVSDGIFGCSRDWETTPGIEMRIKVNNGDGTVDFVEGTKDGENDGMITSETVGPLRMSVSIQLWGHGDSTYVMTFGWTAPSLARIGLLGTRSAPFATGRARRVSYATSI